MGRNKFGPHRGPWEDHEWRGWWGDEPPFHTPVFVLTHHVHPSFTLSDTTFHFVDTDPATVLEQAREAAQGKDVRLGGGATTIREFLDADLVDTLHVVVSPIELGSGAQLWESPDDLLDRFHCDVVPSPSGVTTGTKIEVGGGDALQWGDGEYGVVLAHGAVFDAASWENQATAIADQGATVIAVENIAPESIAAAVAKLHDDGHTDVALMGGSAGADAILQLASQQPGLPDQLVLLSPNKIVDGLGDEPKLFIASEDEPVADVSQQLADNSPGQNNDVILLPGSDHGQNIFDGENADAAMGAILERLAG